MKCLRLLSIPERNLTMATGSISFNSSRNLRAAQSISGLLNRIQVKLAREREAAAEFGKKEIQTNWPA